MKTTYRFLIVGAAVAFLTSAGHAKAGTTYDDGIAASPKLRAILDERYRSRYTPIDNSPSTITSQTLAGSPKVQAMFASLRTVPAQPQPTASSYAVYRAVGNDGIAASPKLRAMLDERQQTVEVAPLK